MRPLYILILSIGVISVLSGVLLLTFSPSPNQPQSTTKPPNVEKSIEKSVASNFAPSVQDSIRQDMNAPRGYILKSIYLGFRGSFFSEVTAQPKMAMTDALLSSNTKLRSMVASYLPKYNEWVQECERIGIAECEENNTNPPDTIFVQITADEYNALKTLLNPEAYHPIDLELNIEQLARGSVGRERGTFVSHNNAKFLIALYTIWDFPQQKELNFDKDQADGTPSYLQIGKIGSGTRSVWVVKQDSSAPSRPNVLAQTADEPVAFHFPYALVSGEQYSDLAISVKFKAISGKIDQRAGLIFRFVDSDNYYVISANVLKNNVILFKYAQGKEVILVEGPATVTANEWHMMKVVAIGDTIKAYFDDRLIINTKDSAYKEGMVGLWTKSDSVSYFDDLTINH